MATINISLSESMKDFVDERVTGGGYSTTSEYFRDLVREESEAT
ncbi:ribbon-helix-helix domain-containing protein [Capsulimonas corticalis]|nr:ribbon-helix-helix domain-containing protein [Capsulimonas corticalis]